MTDERIYPNITAVSMSIAAMMLGFVTLYDSCSLDCFDLKKV